MTPRYFTFIDRAAAEAAILPHVEDLDTAEPLPRVGRLMGITFELIEVLRFPPVRDEADNVVVAERTAPGFHVNMLVPDGIELPAELEPFEVTPATPMRRFSI